MYLCVRACVREYVCACVSVPAPRPDSGSEGAGEGDDMDGYLRGESGKEADGWHARSGACARVSVHVCVCVWMCVCVCVCVRG